MKKASIWPWILRLSLAAIVGVHLMLVAGVVLHHNWPRTVVAFVLENQVTF